MELFTKEKERRLSAKQKMFPNLSSAVIRIAVVALLLTFAVFAIDRNNVNRLGGYHKSALAELQKVEAHLSLRLGYATTLSSLLGQGENASKLASLVALAGQARSAGEISETYLAMDAVLALLQKELFADAAHRTYAQYFEKMYEEELLLTEVLLSYHAKADYYNRQKHAFPAVLTANRMEMKDLPLFAFSAALKGRP